MVQVLKFIDLFSQKKREPNRAATQLSKPVRPVQSDMAEVDSRTAGLIVAGTAALTPPDAPPSIDPAKLARLQAMVVDIPTKADPASAWNAECAALIDELVTSRLSSAEFAAILSGLISYRRTGVTPPHAHESFITAFSKTSGVFQDVLHRCLFPHSVPFQTNVVSSPHLGSLDVQERSILLKELRQNGYCVLPNRLEAATLARSSAAAERLTYRTHDRFSNEVPDRLNGIDPAQPPRCGGASAIPDELMTSSLFAELMHDPLIEVLASEYLETASQPISAQLWYSFPTESASSELAQLFHYDLDTVRWLKVFYYLSDVREENGPHEYVEGSHAPGSKSPELLERGYARISDEDIASFQRGAVRSITGPAGTVILGDTRAFHKGARVKFGHRLIFQPIYAPSKISFVQDA